MFKILECNIRIMTNFYDISRPIDAKLQKKLFNIATYYSDIIKDIEKTHVLENLYTSKSGYIIRPSDRYNAIVGRRTNNLCHWVNKIAKSQNQLESLKDYSSKHIAWIFTDELKNHENFKIKFRTFINDLMDEEFLQKIDQIIAST